MVCACGEPRYIIRGDVSGLDGMVYMLDSKRNPVDSVMAENGRFEFSGPFTDARRCFITDNSDLTSISKYVLLFIEKGRIYVQEDEQGLYAVGTPSNNAYTAMLGRTSKFTEKHDVRSTADERHGQIAGENDNIALQSVSDNPDDGKPYTDFTQNTPEGVGLSLRSVVDNPSNRYVLLDFWASWCAPCNNEIPYLKSCYAKYHSRGFEILGSSLDRDRESWTAAIGSKGMNWLHVSDIKYWDNAAAALYDVSSIPANFLIDCSTGTIIARDLRGENLEARLSELFD